MRRDSLRLLTVAVVLGASLAGCFGTETGNPPLAPEVDVSRVDLVETPAGLEVRGRPGAISPGGGTVHLANLDGVGALVIGDVAPDGSFAELVEGLGSDVVRVQAKLGGARSRPIDFQFVALPAPLSDCVRLEPRLELDLGVVAVGSSSEPQRIEIHNECSVTVTVSEARLRLGGAGIDLTSPGLPLALPADASATVDVVFSPSRPGDAEDVLLVTLSGAEAGRYAVTLYGEGR